MNAFAVLLNIRIISNFLKGGGEEIVTQILATVQLDLFLRKKKLHIH